MQLARDITALLGRLAVGVVFLVHGLDKWQAGVGATADMFGGVGVPLPSLAALFVIAVEVLGSVAFLLGFAAPIVGIGYAIIGLGAVFLVHLENGLTGEGGYELVLVLALAGLALGFNSGRFSLDRVLFSRGKSRERAADPV